MSVEPDETAQCAIDGPMMNHAYSRVLVLVGEYERALDQLEYLATIPSDLGPG